MYKLMIEVSTLKELQSLVANMGDGTLPVVSPNTRPDMCATEVLQRAVEDALVKGEGKPVRAEKKAKTEAPKPVVEEQKEETQSNEISFGTVKDAMLELAKTKGREATLEVLSRFTSIKNASCVRVTEVQAQDYAAFMEAVQKAMSDE